MAARRQSPQRRRITRQRQSERTSLAYLKPKTRSRDSTPLRKGHHPQPPNQQPIQNNFRRKFTQVKDQENNEIKLMINLEDLIQLEEKLDSIINQGFQSQEVIFTCQEWWELSSDQSFELLDRLFRDSNVKQALRESQILQCLSVMLAYYLIRQNHKSKDIEQKMKRLLQSSHQCFLHSCEFIMQRIPQESKDNIWANSLKEVINQKAHKYGRKRNPYFFLSKSLQQNIILLTKVCKFLQTKLLEEQIDLILTPYKQILDKIETIAIQKTRKIVEETLCTVFGSSQSADPIFLPSPKNLQDNELIMAEPPFLPPTSGDRYTLILDLDETLVHYVDEGENKGKYTARPFSKDFLYQMSKFFEVVVFTAGLQEYADWILDELDKEQRINHRLYRQHTIPAGEYYIKDLTKLGRDIKRVIIVDNVAENFQLQPDNGIYIRSWVGDTNDRALKELMPILMCNFQSEIAQKQVKDVRMALRSIRDQMLSQILAGNPNPHLNISLDNL